MDNKPTGKNSSIPREQWDRFKPEIIELYLNRNLTLQEVADHMRTQRGFDTKPQTYRPRLEKWGIRKNFTAQQKLQLWNQQDGKTDDVLRQSRLRRPIQKNGQRFKLAIQPSTYEQRSLSSSEPSAQHITPSGWRSQDARLEQGSSQYIDARTSQAHDTFQRQLLQESPESKAMELILTQANDYYTWYFSQPPDLVPRYSHSSGLADVFDIINKALDKLPTGDNKFALRILDEGCTNANKMFLAQPLQIIVQFSACFSRRGWSQYGKLQWEAMNRLTEMARTVLGKRHIVTAILDLMSQGYISRYLSSRLLRLTADVAIIKLKNSPLQLLDAALHLTLLSSEIYRDIDEESPLLRYRVVSPQGWDRDQDTCARTLYKLGYLRSTQQQPVEALRLWDEVIKLTEGVREGPLLSTRMWTFNCIGHLCAKANPLERSVKNYRSALELSRLSLPMNQADRLRRFEWLTKVQDYYAQNGEVEKMAELQVEFSDLWSDYNKRIRNEVSQ